MTLARVRLAIAFFLTLTVSCADSTSSESCQLGQQMPCTCGNGESSQRICLETGAGYSACIGCALDGGTSIPPIQADLAQAVRPDDGGVLDFAGVAKPSCSAANCTGCCNGNTCAVTADQSDQQCHVGSLTVCQKCPTGFSCVADQACAKQGASCDPGSCPTGCCEGGVCLEANPSHCGAGGGSCTQCAKGSLCTSGSCQNNLDPDAVFYLTINTVEVESTDASGVGWDADTGGSPPDPKVCFYDSAGTLSCTKECSDMLVCKYPSVDGLLTAGNNPPDNDDALGTTWIFYGSELASGLPFRVWDMDYAPFHRYDTIASGTMFKITKLQTQYAISPFQRVRTLTFTLKAL